MNENTKLVESGLSRLNSLLASENPRYCFAMISACRGFGDMRKDHTKKEIDDLLERNGKKTEELKNQIKRNRFGYVAMEGGYVEENSGGVTEKSFLVIAPEDRESELRDFAIEMCNIYNQDSVLFVDSKNHFGAYLQKDGTVSDILPIENRFNFDQHHLAQYYSRMMGKGRGARFQIVDINDKPKETEIVTSDHVGKNFYIRKVEEHFELASNLEMMGLSANRLFVEACRLNDIRYKLNYEKFYRENN